jgi:hypothetical protein
MQRMHRQSTLRDINREVHRPACATGTRAGVSRPTQVLRSRAGYWLLASSLLSSSPKKLGASPLKLPTRLCDAGLDVDRRVLPGWAEGKRKHVDVLRKADEALARFHPQLCKGDTYIEELVAARPKYRGRPDVLGALLRLLDALDLHEEPADKKLPLRLRDKTARARSLLLLQHSLYRPRRDRCLLSYQLGQTNLWLSGPMAAAWVQDSPWTVLQFLLSTALNSDVKSTDSLGVLALDLAAARWATHTLWREASPVLNDWPGLAHVIECMDAARNLFDAQDVRQACHLIGQGYCWPPGHTVPSECVDQLPWRLQGLLRAYGSQLEAFGLKGSDFVDVRAVADASEWSEGWKALDPLLEKLRRSGAMDGPKVGH